MSCPSPQQPKQRSGLKLKKALFRDYSDALAADLRKKGRLNAVVGLVAGLVRHGTWLSVVLDGRGRPLLTKVFDALLGLVGALLLHLATLLTPLLVDIIVTTLLEIKTTERLHEGRSYRIGTTLLFHVLLGLTAASKLLVLHVLKENSGDFLPLRREVN